MRCGVQCPGERRRLYSPIQTLFQHTLTKEEKKFYQGVFLHTPSAANAGWLSFSFSFSFSFLNLRSLFLLPSAFPFLLLPSSRTGGQLTPEDLLMSHQALVENLYPTAEDVASKGYIRFEPRGQDSAKLYALDCEMVRGKS
jgi:hypothetical protein